MARDLYGEMLSRALNRGAPQGHFAAYITPQEGGALRAMGGGVAPGGGQFMANGIPSFEYDIGGGLGSMSASDVADAMDMAAAVGYGAGSSGMGRSAEQMEAIAQAVRDVGAEGPLSPSHMAQIQARADRQAQEVALSADFRARQPEQAYFFNDITANRELSVEPMTEAERQAYGRAHDLETGLIGFETEMEAVERGMRSAPRNVQAQMAVDLIGSNPANKNEDGTFNERGVAALGRDISDGGAGYFSPAATMARNNAVTPQQARNVNQHSDRTGGYAVNDPESGVSVPEGMNMGLVPAAMGTLAGLVSPTMGLGMTFSGIPTLGTMALDFARKDTGALGSAARGLQQSITNFTQPVRDFVQPARELGARIGSNVRDAASGIGDFLTEQVVDPITGEITDVVSSIGESLPSFPALGDVLSQGETPVGAFQDPQTGGNQEVYVPPQPAPVTEPFVSDDAERQFAEIPPEILARILANVEVGRQRQQQQQQELGLV